MVAFHLYFYKGDFSGWPWNYLLRKVSLFCRI